MAKSKSGCHAAPLRRALAAPNDFERQQRDWMKSNKRKRNESKRQCRTKGCEAKPREPGKWLCAECWETTEFYRTRVAQATEGSAPKIKRSDVINKADLQHATPEKAVKMINAILSGSRNCYG